MNLPDNITRALAATGITELNEMQRKVLEAGTTKDMVLLSPTGSGKTLAFLLPLLTVLSGEDRKTQAMIIAPSRELALQIEGVMRSLATGYKINCCYGGHPLRTEKKSLEHPPTVLIGTPGRILDHIERGNIQLDYIRTLILDEFDKSLELGFLKEMKAILSHLPGIRRRVLTSATESIDIPAFTGIVKPVKLSFLTDEKTLKGLTVHVVQSPVKDKLDTLYALLGELRGESALVFCNLREAVERVSNYLTGRDVANACFHGGMEQIDRERVLAQFRNGSVTVFVSTDLASRGLDIPDVRHVIHYHPPHNEEAFIHRNGRTARMGAEGDAFLILNEVETVPDYLEHEPAGFSLPTEPRHPQLSAWQTLTIHRGKRDKLSRGDVVGFLLQKGELAKEDIGLIEVKESLSFVAVNRNKFASLLARIHNERIKNLTAKYS